MKALEVNNISKIYRLGEVGTGTISHDINRWWHKVRGKEDPYELVTQTNDRNQQAQGDYVYALNDISFSVEQGEVLGIIGRNGAGKSTLLKILSQITAPTSGNIKSKGRIASLLEVGTGMHPEMTARENIYLNGAILGMTKKEIAAKFDEILDFSGCTMYVDTPLKRFSSGMRVRLGFAVAAFLEPEILIVDEVLAVGDAEFQKKAIGKMNEITKTGKRTVLFVSHNMNSVSTLCSRAIYMDQGQIKAMGKTSDIIDLYLNEGQSGSTSKSYETNERPGDEVARLESYSLIDSNNSPIEYVDIDQKIGISFQIEILEDGHQPIPNIRVKTLKGDVAFLSAEKQSDNYFKRGKYEIKVWIPDNLLNDEIYTIDITLTSMAPYKMHFNVINAISFNVIENIDLRKAGHNQKIQGILRPLLDWNITKLK